jgi:hypothetical protein
MFGIMQHLNVVICENAEDAIAKGYSKEQKYSEAKPVTVEEVVIVRNGTKGGNSTADLVLADEEGNKYVVMITGNLLKSLPV